MDTVQVLLSSYNGERYISEQIDSILAQENVNIYLLIRDDGSTDGTAEILNEYEVKHNNIEVIRGKNIGWMESFMELVFMSGDYDYYAFSDQDDVWLPKKITRAIQMIKDRTRYRVAPVMYYSNVTIVDEMLNPLNMKKENKYRLKKDITLEHCLAQGCVSVFNKRAKELFVIYRPNITRPHDRWFPALIAFLGESVYDEASYILWRRHSSASTILKLPILERLKIMYDRATKNYDVNASIEEFLKGYGERLSKKDYEELRAFMNYKKSLKDKIKVLCSRNVRGYSLKRTIFVKFLILFSRY